MGVDLPLVRRLAGRKWRVCNVCVAGCIRRAAADVIDGHPNRVLALLGVCVRAVNRKAAAALRDNSGFVALAINGTTITATEGSATGTIP